MDRTKSLSRPGAGHHYREVVLVILSVIKNEGLEADRMKRGGLPYLGAGFTFRALSPKVLRLSPSSHAAGMIIQISPPK
jgi:hypothetical protein